ncbi:phosphatase PAP2 family protein [Bacillus sp. AK031]
MLKKRYTSAWLSFAVFLAVLMLVATDYIKGFDRPVFELMEQASFLKHFSIIGTELVIGTISILLILWLALKERDFTGIIFTVLAIGGGNYINKFLKETVERERPAALHGEEGFSFPSGHAMVGVIFLLVMAFFIARMVDSSKGKLSIYILAAALALLTGISRVVDAAHYPSDVLAGFLIGFSYYILCEFIYVKLKTRK